MYVKISKLGLADQGGKKEFSSWEHNYLETKIPADQRSIFVL